MPHARPRGRQRSRARAGRAIGAVGAIRAVGGIRGVRVAAGATLALAVLSTPTGAATASDDDAPSAGASIPVTVTVPPGALSLNGETVEDRSGALLRVVVTRVVVTDTRAGDQGFALVLAVPQGGPPALVASVRVERAPADGAGARDARTPGPGLAAPGHPVVVARRPAGLGLGSVAVTATVVTVRGDAEPALVWTAL